MTNPSFSFYFVTFIDILGFSLMVKNDCEANDKNEYLSKLFKIHNNTKRLKRRKSLKIFQFSDSIIITSPYDKSFFKKYLSIIAKTQIDLFHEGILTRGGISFGKHFEREDFIFSNGLIDAFFLEQKKAINPRIVVSNDLINLIYPNKLLPRDVPILKENDEEFFLDYFKIGSPDRIKLILEKKLNESKSKNLSVRNKIDWLINYFNFKFPQSKIHLNSRFLNLDNPIY